MASRPACLVFDALGTLFSLDAARRAFAARGLPALAFDLWLARVLRDGFALAATETFAPFQSLARGTLAVVSAEQGWPLSAGDIEPLVAAMASLDAFPDARAAFELARGSGVAIPS